MAPKLPAASSLEEEASSGEEEEDEGMSRDGSSSEEEEGETQAPRPNKSSALPSTPAAPKKSAQSSSSESGSDSDTESGRNVKPMEETPKVKNPARSALKRPIETMRDAKRAKKSSEADADDGAAKSIDESKKLFQRLWSEDDEIAILNGMIDYTAKKLGADPALDMNAFHDFIKKSLHVDVTRAQLMDKIRRLKKKYRNNAGRGKKGADPTFTKPHEQRGFELSKKIWGGGEETAPTPVVEQQPKPNANATPKKNQRGSTSRTMASLKSELLPKEEDDMKIDDDQIPPGCLNGNFVALERALGAVGLPESFLKPGLELTGESKRAELEQEWKKLHVAELELFVKRTELIRDQAKLILEAYNSSNK